MNNRLKWFRLIVAGAVIVSVAVFGGCESPLDPDTGLDESQEPGDLTVSVSGVDMDLVSTTEGDDDLLFAAFVFEGGADSLGDDWGETWVALVAEPITDGSASGTAFVVGDDARPEWTGDGGAEYDIYPTVYRVTLPDGQDGGPPQKGGDDFFMVNPEYIYATVDWQSPITYQQDGNESRSIDFADFLSSAAVVHATGDAFHLVGQIFENVMVDEDHEVIKFPEGLEEGLSFYLAEFENGENPTIGDKIDGVSGEVIEHSYEGEELFVVMELDFDGYEFPEVVATASGTLTLTMSGTGPKDIELQFVAEQLTLTEAGGSVIVGINGSFSEFGEHGPTSVEGIVTYDGIDHDLQVISEIYGMM